MSPVRGGGTPLPLNTGRYFKVRDDNLSSKQGSLCTFIMILMKIILKYFKVYIYIYLYLLKK